MNIKKLILKATYAFLKLYNINTSGLIIKKPGDNHIKPPVKFYDLKIKDIHGNDFYFSSLKGKKVLLVNTASACGYTGQYEHLEKLQKQFEHKLRIIGFPCNDFGNQEQGSNDEINNFCTNNFNVSFLLSEKIKIKGPQQHPVYQWLCKKEKNGWNTKLPGWNFCKYVVNENGELTAFFSEKTDPTDKSLLKEIND